MFDWLVDFFTAYPYLGVAAVIMTCSIGLPLPEELVLIAAGYVCFKVGADLPLMISTSVIVILSGDMIPFFLGRVFGSRLLRLRPLRLLVTKRRLSLFDGWFRRRGDLVIFVARFVAGLRVVAYFTAGTMRMPYQRFILLDLLGIACVVPVFTWVGYRFGHIIDVAIERVQQVERGILIGVLVAVVAWVLWRWLRGRRRAAQSKPETYVQPSAPTVTETANPSEAASLAGSGPEEPIESEAPEAADDEETHPTEPTNGHDPTDAVGRFRDG